MEQTLDTYRRPDVAVNNAATNHAPKLLADVTLAEFDNVIDLNLRGLFVALQAEISTMMRTGGGSIINVGSTAGLRAVPRLAAYTSAKHALVGLTTVAALDDTPDASV
jgi:NAD(P)-dependent dehydrogenase (short-subunit alcohol dehydrogenase family)